MFEEQTAIAGGIAPYIPYRTFRTFIDDVRQQGIPSRFDASALQRFSGSVRTQLLSALRFLNLVSTGNEPLPSLMSLHDAIELDQWRDALAQVLDKAYGPIMALDLAHITPTHLNQEFGAHYKAKDAVTQKQVTFFLHAAKDAGIALSSRVVNKTRTRTKIARRPTTAAKKTGDVKEKITHDNGTGGGTGHRELPPGTTRTPIALGTDRLAYIELPMGWDSKKELKKLLKLLELSLGDNVEE